MRAFIRLVAVVLAAAALVAGGWFLRERQVSTLTGTIQNLSDQNQNLSGKIQDLSDRNQDLSDRNQDLSDQNQKYYEMLRYSANLVDGGYDEAMRIISSLSREITDTDVRKLLMYFWVEVAAKQNTVFVPKPKYAEISDPQFRKSLLLCLKSVMTCTSSPLELRTKPVLDVADDLFKNDPEALLYSYSQVLYHDIRVKPDPSSLDTIKNRIEGSGTRFTDEARDVLLTSIHTGQKDYQYVINKGKKCLETAHSPATSLQQVLLAHYLAAVHILNGRSAAELVAKEIDEKKLATDPELVNQVQDYIRAPESESDVPPSVLPLGIKEP